MVYRENVQVLAAGEMTDGEIVRAIVVQTAGGAIGENELPDFLVIGAAGLNVQVAAGNHAAPGHHRRPAVAQEVADDRNLVRGHLAEGPQL